MPIYSTCHPEDTIGHKHLGLGMSGSMVQPGLFQRLLDFDTDGITLEGMKKVRQGRLVKARRSI